MSHTTTTAAPLTPPGCDLRDIPACPVPVSALTAALECLPTATALAALALTVRSWHQVPAASLPTDDAILSRLTLTTADAWAAIKSAALADFVECSDGRLYHRTLAPVAAAAWAQKLKTAAYRAGQRQHGSRRSNPAKPPTHQAASESATSASVGAFAHAPHAADTPAIEETAPIVHEVPKTPPPAIPASESFALEIFDAEKANAAEVATEAKDRTARRADVETVFDHWQSVMGKGRAKLDDKRAKLISSRLKEFSADDLCRAIDGCKSSAFHQGDNGQRTVYNELSLILRNVEQVEKFMRMADAPRPAVPSTRMSTDTLSAFAAVFGASASSPQQQLLSI